MVLDPAFAAGLKDLVIMGGVFAGTTGSIEMPGEFNVWSDPEAARIVLESGVVARWVGLDVTRQVRLTRAEAQVMAADPHPFVSFAGRYSVAWIDHLAADRGSGHRLHPAARPAGGGGRDPPGTADVRRRPPRGATGRGGPRRADRRPAPRPGPQRPDRRRRWIPPASLSTSPPACAYSDAPVQPEMRSYAARSRSSDGPARISARASPVKITNRRVEPRVFLSSAMVASSSSKASPG